MPRARSSREETFPLSAEHVTTTAPETQSARTPGLLTTQPWLIAGISRSSWFRLAARGATPAPVSLPGCRTTYRISDVIKWVEGLRTKARR
jgi:predicted DNA-binding transcriptional regulator AlpA